MSSERSQRHMLFPREPRELLQLSSLSAYDPSSRARCSVRLRRGHVAAVAPSGSIRLPDELVELLELLSLALPQRGRTHYNEAS